jgi:hypothetical protein
MDGTENISAAAPKFLGDAQRKTSLMMRFAEVETFLWQLILKFLF